MVARPTTLTPPPDPVPHPLSFSSDDDDIDDNYWCLARMCRGDSSGGWSSTVPTVSGLCRVGKIIWKFSFWRDYTIFT